jgi:hypothetical protein
MVYSFIKPAEWDKMPLYKKIQYYASQLDERYSPYVDKIEAKKIVKEICGDDISIAPIIRILNSPDDFLMDDINENHMVKSSHGSGWNININEYTSVSNVIEILNKWNTIYSYTERQYSYIKPRFFIEEKVNGPIGNADVFMFRCIHGEPRSIGIKRGYAQNSYDINWNPITCINIIDVEKPFHLDKMLTLSRRLSSQFEFVRVDFYYVNGIIYFSEFTFTPARGRIIFPMELENKFGSMWI